MMSLLLDCLYVLVGLCLLPLWLYRLPRAHRYRAGLMQRLGGSPRLEPGVPRLWLHCASVGEAGIPRRLVERLLQDYPGWQVVFSTSTDTGARRLRELYPDGTVFYMPLDLSWCVRRALERVRPRLVMLVELEVWPNFMLGCRKLGVPVAIVNGRISPASRRWVPRVQRHLRGLWDAVAVCCARSRDDAAGFVQVGMAAAKVHVCGSLKYDVLPTRTDEAKAQRLAALFGIEPGAPVLVAGSTHRGEEALLATVYRDLRLRHRRLRMIIAPRHVERAAEAATAVAARNLPVARKSELDGGRQLPRDAVIVVDTIGDLLDCYALATCAFVGRSLLPPGGGQNVMEPAGLGVPVIVGPHTGNFRPEMEVLREKGAAVVVAGRRELTAAVDRLLSAPDEVLRMGSAARCVILESQGATQRTLERLAPLLQGAGGPAGHT
jgi:3-deoxy-D-manno-octulosonic-acid transferase